MLSSPLHPQTIFARRAFMANAEKRGVQWRAMAESFDNRDVYAEFKALEDKTIEYPDYYNKPFHAYPEGNLNWKAAFEAVPGTYVMVRERGY